MKQIKLINLENVSDQEAEKYSVRKAVRAIVFDENKLIALLHATKNYYYKLPGGGVEGDEDNKMALERECKEEIGCNIEIIQEVGLTVEYRKKYNLKQTSYCYIAKLIGEKGVLNLTQDEVSEGFEAVWLPLKEALERIRESKPVIYEGPYMVSRDLAILEAAKESLLLESF